MAKGPAGRSVLWGGASDGARPEGLRGVAEGPARAGRPMGVVGGSAGRGQRACRGGESYGKGPEGLRGILWGGAPDGA